jgi:SAM-dependent methyltransferase
MSVANQCIGCGSQSLALVQGRTVCQDCSLEFDIHEQGLNYASAYSDDESLYAQHFQSLDRFQAESLDKLHSSLLPFEASVCDLMGANEYKSIVDLGCGTGRFLRAVGAVIPSAKGYELANTLVDRLKWHGRNVTKGGIDEFLAAPETPDAITLFEVVEHLQSPGHFMRQILEIKSPKMLAIVVPEWATRRTFDLQFASHDVPPNHLSWWSPQALKSMLQCPGYTIRVQVIPEKRMSMLKHFLRNLRWGSNSASWLQWFKAILNPPVFWLLAIAEKNT